MSRRSEALEQERESRRVRLREPKGRVEGGGQILLEGKAVGQQLDRSVGHRADERLERFEIAVHGRAPELRLLRHTLDAEASPAELLGDLPRRAQDVAAPLLSFSSSSLVDPHAPSFIEPFAEAHVKSSPDPPQDRTSAYMPTPPSANDAHAAFFGRSNMVL